MRHCDARAGALFLRLTRAAKSAKRIGRNNSLAAKTAEHERWNVNLRDRSLGKRLTRSRPGSEIQTSGFDFLKVRRERVTQFGG